MPNEFSLFSSGTIRSTFILFTNPVASILKVVTQNDARNQVEILTYTFQIRQNLLCECFTIISKLIWYGEVELKVSFVTEARLIHQDGNR